MNFLTSLIPAPWGILVRWVVIIGLIGAVWASGYTHGLDHQQDIDAVAHAKQVNDADKYNADQRAKQHQIAEKYLQEKADVEKQAAGLRRALGIALDGLRIRPIPAIALQSVSSDRPSAAGPPGSTDVDARFSEAVQHDARGYGPCTVQLNYLLDAVTTGGGDRP